MTSPTRTNDAITGLIVSFRRKHPRRGPKKIRAVLAKAHPDLVFPAVSTIGEILNRYDLIDRSSSRRSGLHPTPTRPGKTTSSGDRDTTDFKGQFRLGNGQYCYALTIVEAFSHFVLACAALTSTEFEPVKKVFERVFRTYGMPLRILSDNGGPFASTGLARVSRLSLWWMRYGIIVERICPGRPDQNGSHERMHRDLKAETTRPPAYDIAGQQRLFARFVRDYNFERPHEALGQQTPAEHFVAHRVPFPSKPPELVYPGYFETRKADNRGMISWKGQKLFLTLPLAGETVGLAETSDGIWSIYYASTLLGRFDERTKNVHG